MFNRNSVEMAEGDFKSPQYYVEVFFLQMRLFERNSGSDTQQNRVFIGPTILF